LISLKVGGDQPIGGPRVQKVEGDRFPSVPMVVAPMSQWSPHSNSNCTRSSVIHLHTVKNSFIIFNQTWNNHELITGS